MLNVVYAVCLFMLSITNKLFMLSVVTLNVIILNVSMLRVIILNVAMLKLLCLWLFCYAECCKAYHYGHCR